MRISIHPLYELRSSGSKKRFSIHLLLKLVRYADTAPLLRGGDEEGKPNSILKARTRQHKASGEQQEGMTGRTVQSETTYDISDY